MNCKSLRTNRRARNASEEAARVAYTHIPIFLHASTYRDKRKFRGAPERTLFSAPGDDLLAHLLAILVGPALDQPQQARDLPQVTAPATNVAIVTELNR